MGWKEEIDLLSFASASLGFLGAFFLVRSILQTTSKQIALTAGTYWSSNPHLLEGMIDQKTDSLVGFCLTLLSSVGAVLGAFLKISVGVSKCSLVGIFLFTAAVCAFGYVTARLVRRKIAFRPRLLAFLEEVRSAIEAPYMFDAHQLTKKAEQLNLMPRFVLGSDPVDCLKNVAKLGGSTTLVEKIENMRHYKRVLY